MNRTTRDKETERRSTEEIRQDIDRTRADMDETVDALEGRLTPGRIVDEVWTRISRGGSGEGSGFADVLRDHPVPFALMGLGLGWLAIEQSSSRTPRPRYAGSYRPAPGRRGPFGPDAVHRGGHEESGPSMTERARDVGDKAREKFREAGEKLSSSSESGGDGESMTERAGETVERAWHEVEHQTRRAGRGFTRMLEENPIAVGAVALGLGLASGLSVPSTEAEDRWVGQASDRVKGEARRMGEEATERAGRVAEHATEAASEEMERQAGGGQAETGGAPGRTGPSGQGASSGRTGSSAQHTKPPEDEGLG